MLPFIAIIAIGKTKIYNTMDEEINIRTRIGDRVKQLRLDNKLSIRDLADQSGLNKSTIVNMEAGKFDARLDTLEKLEKVFNKRFDFID